MGRAIASISALVCSACSPSFLVVSVDDPKGVARGADSLAIGFDLASLESRSLGDRMFPVSFSLAFKEPGMVNVYVEAREGATPVARGFGVVELGENLAPVTMQLGKACGGDADCTDGQYCNGAESCLNAVCVDGPVPCPELNSCATNRCDEEFDVCELRLDPELDDFDPCTIDGCGEGRRIVHLPVPENDSCIGRSGHCESGQCVLECNDGHFDPPAEECDDGFDNPSCIDCKEVLERVSTIGGIRGVISADGSIVAFRDPGHVVRLNRVTGELTEIAGFTGIGDGDRISMSNDGARLAAKGFGRWLLWDGEGPMENQPEGLEPIGEIAVDPSGARYIVYSNAIQRFITYDFGAIMPSSEILVEEADGVPLVKIAGSNVAWRGFHNRTTCAPCVHVNGVTTKVGEVGFDWAFARTGQTLFVASSTADAVLRYQAPFDAAGVPIANTEGSIEISASESGNRIAFTTARALVPEDQNNTSDVYVIDLSTTGMPRRLATAPGMEPNGYCSDPRISADGNWVIFSSEANNLDPSDMNDLPDSFVSPFSPPPT